MLEDFLGMIESLDKNGNNPVTRKKKEDWTFWAIIIGAGAITAILLMGFLIFSVFYLS
jgi:hypothetical protein